MVTAVRTKVTKSKATMAYLTAEDLYGSIEVLVFPKILSQYGPMLQAGNAVLLRGRISLREDEEPKLLCDQAAPAPEPGGQLPDMAARPQRPTGQLASAPSAAGSPSVVQRPKEPSAHHGLCCACRRPSAPLIGAPVWCWMFLTAASRCISVLPTPASWCGHR